ncbi:MAG: hypothetical protein KC442_22530 [Thermomicrobiales bacterium]|nr:hypothetical protein [Thermomicrobiales bacterium]
MDAQHFDTLARALVNRNPRRRLLGLLAAAPLGSVLLASPVAGKRGKKRKSCQNGLLACKRKKGKKRKVVCVDGLRDAAHCGACGNACAAGQSCCDGACVSTSGGDPAHCGACGNVCTPPQTCGGGGKPGVCGCTPTTCAAQGKNCGEIANGCGGALDCGECTEDHHTCGGGGTPNVCGCLPIGAIANNRFECCSQDCCRDELPEGQCRCAGGCG